MNPKPVLAFLTGIAALGVSLAGLSAAAPRTSNIEVTSTLADLGGDTPLRVQSDRKGAYVTKVVNKVKQVTSILITNSNGHDWSLTTYYSSKGTLAASDRKVFFDLREQVSAGAFATPFLGTDAYGAPVEYGYATAHLIAKCSQAGVDMVKMVKDQTVLCPGGMRFRAPDGTWYRFSFAPNNFSGVDQYKVTCTAVDGTGCKVWSLAPSGTVLTGNPVDPNPKSRNKLLLIDSGGAILAEGGDYYLSFSITVAR